MTNKRKKLNKASRVNQRRKSINYFLSFFLVWEIWPNFELLKGKMPCVLAPPPFLKRPLLSSQTWHPPNKRTPASPKEKRGAESIWERRKGLRGVIHRPKNPLSLSPFFWSWNWGFVTLLFSFHALQFGRTKREVRVRDSPKNKYRI